MSGAKQISALIAIVILGLYSWKVCADERFTDNGDGTVTDHYLRLMWSKTDNQGKINWKQAEKWVKYTFPYTVTTQYKNWRLPTLGEVRSLHIQEKSFKGQVTECGMPAKIVDIIELTCAWVWTSEFKDISATVFTFKKGYQFSDLMMHNRVHRVLAVRSLE